MKYVFLFLFVVGVGAAELPPEFVRAIHQVETGGRYGPIKGDKGKALGPFQIHLDCFLDARAYDKSLRGYKYADVAQYVVAKQVMAAYLNRYAKKAIQEKNYERLARVWNGGPSGGGAGTDAYWRKVKLALDQ
jgi:hypothetical protein